jgi:hypothetical protein
MSPRRFPFGQLAKIASSVLDQKLSPASPHHGGAMLTAVRFSIEQAPVDVDWLIFEVADG